MKFPARFQQLASSVLRLVIFVSLLFFLFATPTFAQSQQSTINPNTQPNTNPDVPQNLHTWTQNVAIEVMSAMICQLSGVDSVNPEQKCLGVDQKTGKVGFVEGGGGAIGVAGNLIAATFTAPMHTGDYFKYLAQNFGLAKPAYAQGVGFTKLTPLISLWSVFRNVVYFMFIVVFVVVGVAIMLRVKIDPRTVMSIENQIPKIIIGLLLVTFSFALAGFLIDLMYVMNYLLFSLVSGANVANVSGLNPAGMQGQTPLQMVNGMGGGGVLGGVNGIVNNAATSLTDVFRNVIGFSDPNSFSSIFTSVVAGLIGGFVGIQIAQIPSLTIFGNTIPIGLVGGVASAAGIGLAAKELMVYFIPWLVIYLIFLVAVLWALFRLWFELIKAYIFILVDVVTAPLWIVAGLLPGGATYGFGTWLRDIIANLAVFPLTILLFLLGRVFMEAVARGGSEIFVPPLVGNPAGGETNLLSSLIGIGVILMTPQVLNMTRDALKAPPFKYVASIGQAVSVGPGVVGSTVHAVASPYGAIASFKNLRENLQFARRQATGFGRALGIIRKPTPPEEEGEVKGGKGQGSQT